MNKLIIETLTKQAFSPFGEVIETENRDHFSINNGSTERYNQLATVELSDPNDLAIMSVFRAQHLQYPLSINMLERHPRGSQAFMPLTEQRFLVVVAPPSDEPQANEIKAFITNGKQGVNYAKGVWHHPILALENDSDFLVIDRKGEGHNCDEFFFDTSQVRLLDGAPFLNSPNH